MSLQEVDFKLESFDFEQKNPTFTAKSIQKDFVCENGMELVAKDSVGAPLVWRHEHPIDFRYKKNHIFGKVVDSYLEEGFIVSKYEVYDHTKDHKDFIKILKKRQEVGEPLSISMRFRTYYNEKGTPTHFDVFEHSATPTPACKECTVIDIKNEENVMEKEEILAEIESLETKLTKKDELLESLEGKVEELKKELEEKQNKLKAKDDALEAAEMSKEELAEKVIGFKDRLLELEKSNETLITQIEEQKLERKMDKLENLIEQILEEDGKEMETAYRMMVESKLEQEEGFEKAKTFLEDRLEAVMKRPKAIVKTLEESAEDNKLEGEKEWNELSLEEQKVIAKKALKHNPELYNKLYGDK